MSAGPSTISQAASSGPRDVAAIFHASFHPTKGNTVDWCLTAPGWEDLQHENLSLEFSALPSGLHQVDEDVVYFTASASKTSATPRWLHALSLFRRRRTSNPTYRGFLLSALGVLVIPSYPDASKTGVKKPRPWQHVAALKEVAERCYSRPGSDPSATAETGKLIDVDPAADLEEWYAPARAFLAEKSVASFSLQDFLSQGAEDSLPPSPLESIELLDLRHELASGDKDHIPTLQLPPLLTLLGPSSITLFKHLLARKRVMVYTNVPVGPACTMCYAIVDMVRGIQTDCQTETEDVTIPSRHNGPVRVLGMLTLNDLVQDQKRGLLEDKIEEGRGWVACTTDALFLEKPQYYDLLIDLTALPAYSSLSSSSSSSGFYPAGPGGSPSPKIPGEGGWKKPANFASNRPRPTFYISKSTSTGPASRTSHKLSQIRWAWSDVRLWNDVDLVLRMTPVQESSKPHLSSPEAYPPAAKPSSSTASSAAPNDTTIPKPKKEKSKSKSRERGRDRRGSQSAAATATISSHAESRSRSPGVSSSRIAPTIPTSLADAWKVYEDICLVCANAWMGALCARAGGGPSPASPPSPCRNPSGPCCVPPGPTQPLSVPTHGKSISEPSGKSTAIQLEGDDDILLRTVRGPAGLSPGSLDKMREPSASSCDTYTSGQTDESPQAKAIDALILGVDKAACENLPLDCATTLNVLNILERYALWQIEVLRAYVRSLVGSLPEGEDGKMKLTLTPRDLVLLDLNPLSSGDIKYLEALLAEYAGHVVINVEMDVEDAEIEGAAAGTTSETSSRQVAKVTAKKKARTTARDLDVDLVVKRGWRELIAVVLGFS